MRARWLTLALVFCSGCFGAHGSDEDAGPPGTDAGPPPVMCELYGASVHEIVCPSTVQAGERASITITTSPAACCSSGTIRPSYGSEGFSHRFELEWDACDCCDACRCVGPIDDVVVQTGALEAGRHTIEAHGVTCEVEALAFAECGPPLPSTDFRAPEHLLEGQAYPVTLTNEPGVSCACSPRVVGADELEYSMELCDCCDVCDCIDSGYQASHVRDPLDVGQHVVVIPHGVSQVSVHARSECYEIDVTGLELEAPRRDLSTSGPALTWARVTGEEPTCCTPPTPVVERLDTTGPGIALRLMSCVTVDCGCLPDLPTSASAWFSLGELAPGTHVVRVGDLEQTITLP